jgi:hypothetical protein
VLEKRGAVRLECAIGSLLSGSPIPAETLDADLRGNLRVAEKLAALDLARDSRVRETLHERVVQALAERRARPVAPARRRPWVLRRPVFATSLGVALALALLAVVAPRSLAALVDPVVRMIEMVRVGEHTQIVRPAPRTDADVAASVDQHKRRLANGESWFLSTRYGGFGGGVCPGEQSTVRRVSSLEDLRSFMPTSLLAPTGLHRQEPVRFDHAFVAPGGIVLIFFGSGATEVFLAAFPVGEGRSVAFGRSTGRSTPDGRIIVESPELKAEAMSLRGQAVVWDPGPEPPSSPRPDVLSPSTWSLFRQRDESSALRWEANGVSYSLMGRSLTREEAVDLFSSVRPLDELP